MFTVTDVLNWLDTSEKEFSCSGGISSKRSNSWRYCYQEFRRYSDYRKLSKNDIDHLALVLTVYLSSWGMYRGSSYLLDTDYKIHIYAVEKLLKHRNLFINDNLFNHDAFQSLFGEYGAYVELENYYSSVKKVFGKGKAKNRSEIPSDTLITKILLGVYGCVPAYDINLRKGLLCWGVQQQLTASGNALYGGKNKKILPLIEVLKNTKLNLEIQSYQNKHTEYTFMKVIDMYFYGLGCYINTFSKEKQKSVLLNISSKIKNHYWKPN